ncbi:Potassium channel [Podila humilis]|nr:Potassium channel [Podila humilis]
MDADSSQYNNPQQIPTYSQNRHRHRPSIAPILEEGKRIARSLSFAPWNDQTGSIGQDELALRGGGGGSRRPSLQGPQWAREVQQEDTTNGAGIGANNASLQKQYRPQQQQRPEYDTTDTSSTLTSYTNYSNGKSYNTSNTRETSKSYDPSLSPMDANRSDSIPHPRLQKVLPYVTIGALQAYTTLTVVRCVADPTWFVLKENDDKTGGGDNSTHSGKIGLVERMLLGFTVAFMFLSCVGFTLRITDRAPWFRRIPVISAVLQSIFCTSALIVSLRSNIIPANSEFSHGFLSCVISVVLSAIVAIMLAVDWWRNFPSAGLTAQLKALIISSFMMTTVIIIGAAVFSKIEGWSYDDAINFCIVSFATIGYGNISPKTVGGQLFLFTYGVLGISSIAYFIVSLRNAVIEQFEWRLVEKFAAQAHLHRVQTRMSTRDLSFPLARFEEEQRVKKVVKRKMIMRMFMIWVALWFGGAGVFTAIERVTLTTIGFGDYVPQEPLAIEFWNIYVFIGLTVFAYVLSLFSESMASHIHLVDDEDVDEDVDEDEMYGWEKCEDDLNAPWSAWGGMLGLDGQKWAQEQHRLGQALIDAEGDMEQAPTQETNQPQPHPQPLNSLTYQDPFDCSLQNEASLDWQRFQLQQIMSRSHQQQHRRSSTGKVLHIPAKERKKMLEAEYFATHGGMMGQSLPGGQHDLAEVNALYNSMYSSPRASPIPGSSRSDGSSQPLGNGNASMISVPTTIRFVDAHGIPHQQRRRSLILSPGYVASSGGMVNNVPENIVGRISSMNRISYGTPAYYTTVDRQRRQQRGEGSIGGGSGGLDRGSSILLPLSPSSNDTAPQSPERPSISSRATSPDTRQQYSHIRFESPMGSPKSLVAQSILLQDQHERDRQVWRDQKEREETAKALSGNRVKSYTPRIKLGGPLDAIPMDEVNTAMEDGATDWPPALKYPRESRSSDATKVASPDGLGSFPWTTMPSSNHTTTEQELPDLLETSLSVSYPNVPALGVPFTEPSIPLQTMPSVSVTDPTQPVGPLGEARTEDSLLKFEIAVDLNQVIKPPASAPKDHHTPTVASTKDQLSQRKGTSKPVPLPPAPQSKSKRKDKDDVEANTGDQSVPACHLPSSPLSSKMRMVKDVGPMNETRDDITILHFEDDVDLNVSMDAPRPEPPPQHLRGKSDGKKEKKDPERRPDSGGNRHNS